MTINYHRNTNSVSIGDMKPGECFKTDNYSVFLVTNAMADGNLTGIKAVNLLTGIIAEFSTEFIVERVDAEVEVNG